MAHLHIKPASWLPPGMAIVTDETGTLRAVMIDGAFHIVSPAFREELKDMENAWIDKVLHLAPA